METLLWLISSASATRFRERSSAKCSAQYSMISVDTPNVILETVKKAEDSEDLVLRMYDAYGQSTQAAVTLGFTPRRVVLCDLMENEIQEISFDANTFTLPVKAFEIVTVKVQA